MTRLGLFRRNSLSD